MADRGSREVERYFWVAGPVEHGSLVHIDFLCVANENWQLPVPQRGCCRTSVESGAFRGDDELVEVTG